MFSLILTPQIAQTQSLQITGGVTESIFKNAEIFLLESTDHQKALEYVSLRKRMDRYRSVMDFVFCELNPNWRLACTRFYAGHGPQLKKQITEDEIVKYDRQLVIALKVAYQLFCDKRCKSWAQYKYEVRKALRAA